MLQNVNHYDRILHRAHTNYLAQVNLELTQTYNMTNNVMNRLTFLATVFIPLSLIGGLWGMNEPGNRPIARDFRAHREEPPAQPLHQARRR